ncbi:MAG: ATP-binding cassette domain-containing protein [Holosporales bacterium]|jgi:putative ABC transport system ATP-binding protein|nr:ATP-binding cassette domain-containing protein [Holosporales bacterium]
MLRLNEICVRDTLKSLELSVSVGKRVLIIGGNGSGKSTLFSVISGRLLPDCGSVIIDGRDVTRTPEYERTDIISSVLQDMKAGAIEEMTILENVKLAYVRRKGDKTSREDVDLFRDKLSIFGMNLENRMRECVKNLSGGERQALSITMATCADYKLLLLDEVTSALSPRTSEILIRSVDEITSTERKTCLMITHDAKLMESFGDRTMEMRNGALHDQSLQDTAFDFC